MSPHLNILCTSSVKQFYIKNNEFKLSHSSFVLGSTLNILLGRRR